MLDNFHAFVVVDLLTFFQNFLFHKYLSGTLSECQPVLIQIRTDVGPNLSPNCLQISSTDWKKAVQLK